ncbi:MAG: D-alanine--D-alanine ligase, partial [Elusimicrobia bacterium]|nr:D-alanine--D-alanine ligase [Elusimicrobiota bacterium]
MMNLKKKKIGVLCGGTSSEREISLMSGKAVYNAIKKLGLKVVLIDVNKNVAQKLVKEKIDLAYITLHGTPGEDGTI